ncbi:MAG: DNA-directed RNA polymerase subunit delta [Selenomonadaceae bacterium]|nr:DNA-directed RNA polymerase subunit delta [Selenomonadaceae bacterium]
MEENFSEMSEVDIAYQILSQSDKDNPIHFKKLIREVIAKKDKVVQDEAAAISEIYTMINMDSRFQYVKDGLWGLSDWYPPETKRTRGSSKTTDKTVEKKSSTSSRLKAEEEPEDLS